MNANELADAMQGVISVLNVHHEEDCLFIANEAQFMLRQQQAENRRCIEALNQIGSWTITGEETNYKAIVSVMRDIANDALYELNRNTMMTWDDVDKEAQEK